MKKRFIFDENYIKRYAKKDKIKWLIIGASALVLLLIIIIVIMANRGNKKPTISAVPDFELKNELVVEAGSTLPEVADYFKKLENIDIDDIKITYPEDFEVSYDTTFCTDEENEKIGNSDGANIDEFECVSKYLRTPASYGITLTVLEKEYTVNLTVQDTVSPVLASKNVEIYAGDTYQLEDFVQYCVDVTGDCQISYYDQDVDEEGNAIDYAKYTLPGTYKIRLYAKDDYDNITEPVEAELKILEAASTLYTVTFNSDGGSEVSSVKAPEGSMVVEPTAPTRDGYEFAGWYHGDTKYDFSTVLEGDITLTAHWNKIEPEGPTNPDNPKPPVKPGTIHVTSVSLNFKKINLYIGDSKTVKAYVYPSNATNKTVTWSSADNSIATVSNGVITGVKAGTTTITATAEGKSASVTVVVKEKSTSGGTCGYGDANYNTQYVLSVNLIQNNCAVDPNRSYNQVNSVVALDYQKLVQQLTTMGFSIQPNYFEHKESYAYVKNTSGLGLVGVQITMTVNVIDPENPYVYMTAQYIIKPDGSRQFIKNNIKKNNVTLQ